MKILFGIWTVIVALTISAVAAYYSIVGLTAIFAAAVLPVIIMGSVLEVAKITTAVWLHLYWHEASILMKTYLTSATVVLMFITSMGIYGFLSKAHIEQSANAGEISAQIERIDGLIQREEQVIARANNTIDSFSQQVSNADTDIQNRIVAQERIISDIERRLANDIAVQNELIASASGSSVLDTELDRVEEQIATLNQLLQQNDVSALQALVGATVDGVRGPNTNRLISEYQNSLESQRTQLLAEITSQSQAPNPIVDAARQEITRLQQAANSEIARAQEAINSFRNQLVMVTTADNSEAIAQQQETITQANLRIDELTTQRFDLESQRRLIEVEVGPVKYIAELVYGESNEQLLEQAVRWVIIILVLVFDPLAVVLILAGVGILSKTREKPLDNQHNNSHTELNTTTQNFPEDSDNTDETEVNQTSLNDESTVPPVQKKSGPKLKLNRLPPQQKL